jgi:hypothetical protein
LQLESLERIYAYGRQHCLPGIRCGSEGAEHALQVRSGDCTEHMLLAGELLARNGITIRRALGLPLRKINSG